MVESNVYSDLRCVHARIATITIMREEKLNALSCDVLTQLDSAVRELAAQQDVRVIIITGSGTRAFAAGADIAELATTSDFEHGFALSQHGQTIFSQFGEVPVPIIAAINGAALGGGLELAMACDMRVAVPHAKLGLPEVTLGLLPGFGGTQMLARLIGPGRAMRMMMTAEPILADEGLRLGLVDLLADAGDALAAATVLAESIAVHPRGAIAAVKSALRTGFDLGLESGLNRERELFGQALLGEEGRSGLRAFLARRKT